MCPSVSYHLTVSYRITATRIDIFRYLLSLFSIQRMCYTVQTVLLSEAVLFLTRPTVMHCIANEYSITPE